jgi:hypothetical protein
MFMVIPLFVFVAVLLWLRRRPHVHHRPNVVLVVAPVVVVMAPLTSEEDTDFQQWTQEMTTR